MRRCGWLVSTRTDDSAPSFHLRVQATHTGISRLTTKRVFTPRKSLNAMYQGFENTAFPESWFTTRQAL